MALMNSLIRGLRLVDRFQLGLAMLALTTMMLVTVADVVLRFGFGHPIYGAYDIVETCLAVFVFNGIAAVFFRRQHIVIDLIDHLVGPRCARVLTWTGELVGAAMLLLILTAMISPAMQAFDYGDRKLELGLPVYIIWIAVIAGGCGALACALGGLLSGLMRGDGEAS
jgi:TRAP-type C4-dicarboxylate transport system permease small subunit